MTRQTTVILIACLAGCGTNNEPPRPTAIVRAYEEGLGAAGRIAVFADEDGRITDVVTTDQLGVARAAITANDMVTIANVGAPKLELTTYVDVEPGDELVIGETEDEGNDGLTDAGALVVAAPPWSDATHVEVGVGLSMVRHAGPSTALHLSSTFFAGTSSAVQVLGIARDTAGTPQAFAIGNATGAGTVTLPAWRTDWDHVAFAISGAPSAATIDAHADLLQGAGRFPLDPITTTNAAFAVAAPRGLGDGLEYEVELRDGEGSRSVRERGALRHDVAVDVGSLLPPVTSVALTTRPDGRPVIAWSADAARADAILIQLTWGDGAHRWTVVVPPTHTGTIRLPELPETLARWRPTGELQVGIALVERSDIATYHDLAARGIEEVDDLDEAGTALVSSLGSIDL